MLALVTDASDNDPSGIGAYSQVGAQAVGLLNQVETTVLFSLATSIYLWDASYANQAALVSKMCRILVVDDNEPVRRSIRSLLGSRKGWFVCGEAADGLQAVQEAKSLRPDLIIMDVSMPKMNGLDAAEIILREVRESRILIISQNDPDIVRRQTVEANVHGFVAKSNIHSELIETIEGILSADGGRKIGKASQGTVCKGTPSSSGIAEIDTILKG